MGKPTGFMEYQRATLKKEPIEQRTKHYHEFENDFSRDEAKIQGSMNSSHPISISGMMSGAGRMKIDSGF